MVSKYPGVTTARKRQGSRPRMPRDYQTGGRPKRFPQNDNVPLRGLSRAAMSLLARKLGLKLIPYGLGYLPDIIEAIKPYLRPYSISRRTMPDAYWTVTCDTGGDMYSSLTVNFTCGAYQRVYDTQGDPFVNITMPANTTASKVEFFKDIGDNPGHPDPRYRIAQLAKIYQRVAGAPSPTPLRLNVPVPQPLEVPGQGYPMELPFAAPVAVPPAKPALDKPRSGEQPEAAPDPEAAPYPWPEAVPYRLPSGPRMPGIYTFPWPGTVTNPGIYPQPETAVLRQPSGRGRMKPGMREQSGRSSRPGNPRRRPPGRGKKETKIHVRSVGGLVWTAFNFLTETIDFAEVLWDSLPAKYQTKGAGLAQKYEDVWKHFGEIDVAQAVVNYANNQIEDYLYGQYGKAQGRAMNQIGGATGLSRAQRQASQYDVDAYLNQHRDPETGEILTNPATGKPYSAEDLTNLGDAVPRIDFDPNTGVVSLTVPALGSASVNLGNRVF